MRELFVYYRVDPANADAAKGAVKAMHLRLRQAHPGLVARLLTRAGEKPTPHTWMETYALPGSTDGIDVRLEAKIEAAAAEWRALVSGARHVEPFIAASD